jgi:hypothetical protein
MRLPPLFVVMLAMVGGYFVSVPLFGHLYGILPDGTTTYILAQKDVEDCKTQLFRSTEPAPPLVSAPDELPAGDDKQAEPACDLRPPKAVAWDWFYLPRALASHSAAGKETSLPVGAIGGVLTSKDTWETAAGAALVGGFLFLLELLGSFGKKR